MKMPRFYLRLILIPTSLFTSILLVIRAQPYDDHELRDLLLPEGCPAPCFMGIRPGVTTFDEAMIMVHASGWVESDPLAIIDGGKATTIRLNWNGKQPDVIAGKRDFALEYQNAAPHKITLIGFYIRNEIELGSLNLLLGNPSSVRGDVLMSINIGVLNHSSVILEEYYDNEQIDLLTILGCPVDLSRILNATGVEVIYYDTLPIGTILSQSSLKKVLRDPHCQ